MSGRYRFDPWGVGRDQEGTMGLLDVINGMQQGPRGPSSPSPQGGGRMSPMTMAILGLLAWKAVKHLTGQPGAAGQPGAGSQTGTKPASAPSPAPASGGPGGGFGDLLKGPLGGLLGGAAAGSVISGGLGDLLKQLQQGGQGETANSWVGQGQNKPISPGDLGKALGVDQINALASQSGLSRDELLSGLSQYLPRVIDHLTPEGRLPTENELSGRL
jgi:uncharacterized protein YidB (DUF937 family)